MENLFILVGGYPQTYHGEILQKAINNKIVEVISNPTKDDLREFGYMELVHAVNIPEYDPEVQMLETSYEIKGNKIYETVKLIDIPNIRERIINNEKEE